MLCDGLNASTDDLEIDAIDYHVLLLQTMNVSTLTASTVCVISGKGLRRGFCIFLSEGRGIENQNWILLTLKLPVDAQLIIAAHR